jgi:nucleoside-diphosphate-sugar epimerase
MRLLLDELCPPGIAEALRERGHDVVSLHDPSHRHLRGQPDATVLAAAADEHRSVVTDDIRDFLPLHRELIARAPARHGLVLFTDRSFPRHRSDVFIRTMVAALDDLLASSIDDVDDGRVIWLSASSSVSGE